MQRLSCLSLYAKIRAKQAGRKLLFSEKNTLPEEAAGTLTRILRSVDPRDATATDQIFPLVYAELRAIARQQMGKEAVGHTLQPTALVNEAYVRLVRDPSLQWENRRHFFAAAAMAMRRILVERAREKRARKRTPDGDRVPLDDAPNTLDEMPPEELLALDEALSRLQQRDERKAQLVSMKFFAGLTNQQLAQTMGLSLTTVKDDWQFARAWLHRELRRV